MGTDKGNSDMTLLEQRQAKRGYILAVRLAVLTGKHHSTIYRWIKHNKIVAEKIEDRQFVRMLSVRDFIGEQAFKLYKLDKVHERMKSEGTWQLTA